MIARLLFIICICIVFFGKSYAVENEIKVCSIPQFYDVLEEIRKNNDFSVLYDNPTELYAMISNNEISCDIYIGNDLKFPYKYIYLEKSNNSLLYYYTKSFLVIFYNKYKYKDDICIKKELDKSLVISIPNPKTSVSGFLSKNYLKKSKIDNRNRIYLYGENEYQTLSFVINANADIGILPYNMIKNNENFKYCYLDDKDSYAEKYYILVFNNEKKESAIKLIQNLKNNTILNSKGFLR